MDASHASLHELIVATRLGDARAHREMWERVHRELRRLAHRRRASLALRGVVQTTALVHDVYLRLAGRGPTEWESIDEFFFAAARAMRNVLVDEARRARRETRLAPGDDPPARSQASERGIELLALDEALARLELRDPRLARLVDLRFFAGLSVQATARTMRMSLATYHRHWSYARAWLQREIRRSIAS